MKQERRRLDAYLSKTSVVCLARSGSDILDLAAGLDKTVEPQEKLGSRLIYAGGLCLGFSVGAQKLKTILPELCEHSDAVCIGRSYPEIFSEHGTVLIEKGAIGELSAQARNGRGHVL